MRKIVLGFGLLIGLLLLSFSCSSTSQKAKDIYIKLREIVPYFEKDSIKYIDIKKVTNFIKNNNLDLETLRTDK